MTGADGLTEFVTVYPGWYQGRAIHIHFKVRKFDGSTETYEFTSQIFFDEGTNTAVTARSPYNTRGAPDTRNATDSIYGSDGSKLLAAVTSDGAGGYVATFDVGLSGLPAGTTVADKTVAATLKSAKVARRSGGGRKVTLTLDLDETVSLDARVLRNEKLLARKQLASLRPGTRTATLVIGSKVAAGGARLAPTLTDARENKKVIQRAVQLPRA